MPSRTPYNDTREENGMPKEDREKKKKEALILYKKGKKLIEIADALGVPAGTVRRWKSEGEWDTERSGKKTNVRRRKEATHIKEEAFLERNKEELTDKRELFCLFYAKYRNQVKAYQAAYKCSYENACRNANTLMKNKEIRRRIEELLSQIRENVEYTIKDIAQKQIDIATADVKDFVDIQEGAVVLKSPEEIDGTLIKRIKNTKYGIAVELKDSQKALDWLTKYQSAIGGEDQGKEAGVILMQPKRRREDIEHESDMGTAGETEGISRTPRV